MREKLFPNVNYNLTPKKFLMEFQYRNVALVFLRVEKIE